MILRCSFLFLSLFIFGLEANQTITTTISVKGGIYDIPSSNSFYTNKESVTIEIKDFKIDKYEVSNEQFGKQNVSDDEIDYPVVNISYKEALSFCKKEGGSLPTKEQWMIASGFDNGKYYRYSTKNYPIVDEDDINIIEDRAIELEDIGFGAELDIVPVQDTLKGNNNIFGMLGNVWEIVDSKGEYVVLKGGSFYNIESFDMLDNQVENKVLKSTLKQYEHIGFRCVYKMDK